MPTAASPSTNNAAANPLPAPAQPLLPSASQQGLAPSPAQSLAPDNQPDQQQQLDLQGAESPQTFSQDYQPSSFEEAIRQAAIAEEAARVSHQPDTFFIYLDDMPGPLLDSAFSDSCHLAESLSLPLELASPGYSPVNQQEAFYDSVMARLANPSDSLRLGTPRQGLSLSQVYQGYDGRLIEPRLGFQTWVTPMLLAFFFLLGLVFAMHSKDIRQDGKDFLQLWYRHSVTPSLSAQRSQYRFILSLLSIVSISLFALQAAHIQFPWLPPASLQRFCGCVAVTSAFFLLRLVVAAFLGFVFFGPSLFRLWQHTFVYINSMLGTVLFPVVLVMMFGPGQTCYYASLLGMGFASLAVLAFMGFEVITFFKYEFSSLYLFLYFCASEVPLLLALAMGYQWVLTSESLPALMGW